MWQWIILKLVCRDWDTNSRDDRWLCLLEPRCALSIDIFSLSRMDGIRKLDLGNYSSVLGDHELHLLASSLISLESLSLNNCPRITQEGIRSLSACTMLHTLELSQFQAKCDLGALTSLRSLNLGWSGYDVSRMGLDQLTGLQHLDLTWCAALTSLGFLKTMTSLLQLTLRGCVGLSEDEMTVLSSLTQLQRLDLSSCYHLSGGSLSMLPDSLTSLDVRGLDMAEGVEGLSRLTRLRHLHFHAADPLATTLLRQSLPTCETRHV